MIRLGNKTDGSKVMFKRVLELSSPVLCRFSNGHQLLHISLSHGETISKGRRVIKLKVSSFSLSFLWRELSAQRFTVMRDHWAKLTMKTQLHTHPRRKSTWKGDISVQSYECFLFLRLLRCSLTFCVAHLAPFLQWGSGKMMLRCLFSCKNTTFSQ